MRREQTEFNTPPVLFIIFNRPDYTKKSLSAIRSAAPAKLYIAADGPRSHISGEGELCEQTRELVRGGIDWKCDVKTLFQESNLGCGKGPSTAITWFFENEEQGIIIEDDVVPHQSFFRFCSELLDMYKDDKRIWSIGGYNYCPKGSSSDMFSESYTFTKTFYCWGWATWRDRWEHFPLEFHEYSRKSLKWYSKKRKIRHHFELSLWNQTNPDISKRPDIWDYPFMLTSFTNRALHIYPQKNMCRNIGYLGTHMIISEDDGSLDQETYSHIITKHPKTVESNDALQYALDDMMRTYDAIPLVDRIIIRIKMVLTPRIRWI